MLEHEDALPLEQNNPALMQDLQAHYQLTAREKEVFAHVYERLDSFSDDLPRAQVETRRTRRLSPQLTHGFMSTHSYIGSNQKMRYLNTLVAILIVSILTGSLAFTFAIIRNKTFNSSTSVGSGTSNNDYTIMCRFALVPSQTQQLPSQQALQTTRNILGQRLVSAGFTRAQVQQLQIHNQLQFEISIQNAPTVPITTEQIDAVHTLAGRGELAFWNTGKQTLIGGDTFDPSQYTHYNPGGKPLFTGADLNSDSLSIAKDPQTKHILINVTMQKKIAPTFATYTKHHIGDVLTITLDNKVVESPTIVSSINSHFQIDGNFTQTQAKDFLSVLKYGPLPLSLKAA
jgi:hypothetical protein